jgi:hypothetical protein
MKNPPTLRLHLYHAGQTLGGRTRPVRSTAAATPASLGAVTHDYALHHREAAE